MKSLARILLAASILLAPALPVAAETPEFTLTLKNHTFTPATLEIPANQKVKLIIDNQDASAEEFESHDLNREKVIPGNSKGQVFVGPLKPGTYGYFGEFNADKATGTIVVK